MNRSRGADQVRRATTRLRAVARREEETYEQGDDQPLAGYTAVMATYAGVVAALAFGGRTLGRRLPERIPPYDLAVGTLATHKLSRLLTKDAVTSPLRAPFTRFQGPQAPSELAEEVRDDEGPARHAFGELLTCPFCLGMWIATGVGAGYVYAPRWTRLATSVLAMLGGSDMLQYGFARLQQSA